jgi:magnesium-transporting ATPase (P-type)
VYDPEEIGNYDGGDNHKKHPDPFLLSGTMIMSGSGRALVCAVGNNTYLSKSKKP